MTKKRLWISVQRPAIHQDMYEVHGRKILESYF